FGSPFLMLFKSSANLDASHSFPTRRSSDLNRATEIERGFLVLDRDFRLDKSAWNEPEVHEHRRNKDEHEQHARNYRADKDVGDRSEEHTSELQSRENLVCRLLLEKKKIKKK